VLRLIVWDGEVPSAGLGLNRASSTASAIGFCPRSCRLRFLGRSAFAGDDCQGRQFVLRGRDDSSAQLAHTRVVLPQRGHLSSPSVRLGTAIRSAAFGAARWDSKGAGTVGSGSLFCSTLERGEAPSSVRRSLRRCP